MVYGIHIFTDMTTCVLCAHSTAMKFRRFHQQTTSRKTSIPSPKYHLLEVPVLLQSRRNISETRTSRHPRRFAVLVLVVLAPSNATSIHQHRFTMRHAAAMHLLGAAALHAVPSFGPATPGEKTNSSTWECQNGLGQCQLC